MGGGKAKEEADKDEALRRAGAGRFHFTHVELTDHVATTAALQSHPPEI